MKKLLLAIVLIVGCEDQRWDNICEVRTKTRCSGSSGCSNSNTTVDECFDEISRDACMLMKDITVGEYGDCTCTIETTSWMGEVRGGCSEVGY